LPCGSKKCHRVGAIKHRAQDKKWKMPSFKTKRRTCDKHTEQLGQKFKAQAKTPKLRLKVMEYNTKNENLGQEMHI